MKILITGASGFIGRHLFESLKGTHEVIGLDHVSANAKNIFSADLSDFDQSRQVLQDNKISNADVIIHLAGVTAEAGNLENISILNTNNLFSQCVSKLSEILNCKKIINFSSSSVYPNVDGNFSELSHVDPSPNPDAIYGLSKYNSEVIISRLCTGKNMIVSHLRPVMVYGEGINKSRLWPVMETELKEKNTISVFGNGKRLINQINIRTLVGIVTKFVEKDLPGIYNVSEETISVYDLAKRIISEKGNKDSKIVCIEKGNTFQFRVDDTKLRSVI